MKNFTNPIQEKYDHFELKVNNSYKLSVIPNEFEDHTDKFGFIRQKPEEYQFLQVVDFKEKA